MQKSICLGKIRGYVAVAATLWVALGVGAVISGFLSIHSPQTALSVAGFIAGVLIIAFIMNKPKRAFLCAVFFLPFTQAPTIKLWFRWRLTEVIMWLLFPTAVVRLSRVWRQLTVHARLYLLALLVYFLYTGVLGIITSPFIEVKVTAALDYTYHPSLRALLETIRGLSLFTLAMMGILNIRNEHDMTTALKLFAGSGAVAGIYAVYQTLVLKSGVSFPMLPGTLAHDYARPFSTFYEPTGLGSYTAVASLFALYILDTSRQKLLWFFILGANLLGLALSLSRAGVAGFLVGIAVIIVMSTAKGQFRTLAYGAAVAVLVWISYRITDYLISDLLKIAFSDSWIRYSMDSRVLAYSSIPSLVLNRPWGMGQGLFLYTSGGASGLIRLFVEGGVVGIFCLLIIHMVIISSLWHLYRREVAGGGRRLGVYLAGGYVSSVATTLNYINTTDAWIWFVWSLPIVALVSIGAPRREFRQIRSNLGARRINTCP